MYSIDFINANEEMEFVKLEYLIANYKAGDLIMTATQIPYFAFDFTLLPNSTVWLQSLTFNESTNEYSFSDYRELTNAKLKSNYFEGYETSNIQKGFYRIAFKDSSSAVYKISYCLLNYSKYAFISQDLQVLFSNGNPIDFSTNPATVPDSESLQNATISKAYSLKVPATEYLEVFNGDNLPTNYSILVNLNFTYGGELTLFGQQANTNGFFTSVNSLPLYWSGYILNVVVDFQNLYSGQTILIALTKNANTYKCLVNGTEYGSNDSTKSIFLGMQYYYNRSSQAESLNRHLIIDYALTPAELATLGGSIQALDNFAYANKANVVNFIACSEGHGLKTYDKKSGTEYTLTSGCEYVLRDLDSLHNLQRGFSLFHDTVTPSNLLRIPLDMNGNSLNKNPSGYTLDENLTQNGYDFLNCESILNNTNIGNPPDLNNFYATEKSFSDIVLESENYIEKTITGNKINDLKIIEL